MVSFTGLNDAQLQAVTSEHKRILCLAGAGTGKTGTLTSRVAYLSDNRVSCRNMLALTFTRNAGKEMKERVINLIGKREGSKLFCNTFHAWCVKVLKEYGHLIGYGKDFSIYDQEDTMAVISEVVNDYGFKCSPAAVFEAHQMEPVEFNVRYPNENYDVVKAIREYEYCLKKNNAFDFDGLLHNVLTLFIQHPEICDYYRSLYQYVFVDEFQDTNNSQWELINMLNPENLFCVGDDFQAIYGWRNANIDIILKLAAHPDWQVIKLEINYRSTMPIITAANNLIKHNRQTEKTLITSQVGDNIEFLFDCDNETEEARRIALELSSMVNKNYSDFAILSRTNKQLEVIYETFTKFRIPCTIVNNNNDVFKKQDIKTVLSCMDLIINPMDDVAFRRVINFPENRMAEIEFRTLQLSATKNETSMFNELELQNDFGVVKSNIVHIFKDLRDKGIQELEANEAFEAIVESFSLVQFYKEKHLVNRINDLNRADEEIISWASIQKDIGEGSTISELMKWMKLRDIQDKLNEKSNTVKLMTVHASKGLEFPTVFIIGLNHGCFPSMRGNLEEERRLMYVAITRAKSKLFISRPQTVCSWGKGNRMHRAEPSQFIEEIT